MSHDADPGNIPGDTGQSRGGRKKPNPRAQRRSLKWRIQHYGGDPSLLNSLPPEAPQRQPAPSQRRRLWIGLGIGVFVGLVVTIVLMSRSLYARRLVARYLKPDVTAFVTTPTVGKEYCIYGYSDGALNMVRLRPEVKWLGSPAGLAHQHNAAIIALAVGETIEGGCSLLVSADAQGRVLVRNYMQWNSPEWNSWELLPANGRPRRVSFTSRGTVAVSTGDSIDMYGLSVTLDATKGYLLSPSLIRTIKSPLK